MQHLRQQAMGESLDQLPGQGPETLVEECKEPEAVVDVTSLDQAPPSRILIELFKCVKVWLNSFLSLV